MSARTVVDGSTFDATIQISLRRDNEGVVEIRSALKILDAGKIDLNRVVVELPGILAGVGTPDAS